MTTPIDLSFNGISKLLGYPPIPECPFKPIEGPIDPRNPFCDLECNDLMGSYVVREDKAIEVLVEIRAFFADCEQVTIGNCFTPRGVFVDLSPEEEAQMEEEFLKGLYK